MSKTINLIPVSELPFIDSIRELSFTERRKYGLYLAGGGLNDYRLAQMTGQGGSSREETWNRQDHKHTCCGSKVCWRHKVKCPRLDFGAEL